MTTLTGYTVNPALYREIGIEAQPGDQVEIYLDQEKVPGFPEFIVGTIQNPITAVCGGTSYSIEYDEADLEGSGVEFIEGDDIVTVVVVSEARMLFDQEVILRDAAIAAALNDTNAEFTNASAVFSLNIGQQDLVRWSITGLTGPSFTASSVVGGYTLGPLGLKVSTITGSQTLVLTGTGITNETITTPAGSGTVVVVPPFEDNAAAVTGGLSVGDFYWNTTAAKLRAVTP